MSGFMTTGEEADRFNERQQRKNILIAESILQSVKDFPTQRFGQLLINLGLAADEPKFYEASSESLIGRLDEAVKDMYSAQK